MKINLSKIKLGGIYLFDVHYNYGAGSGSEGWYQVMGKVKEINAEFIRVIPTENILAASKRSVKISNRPITKVSQ